MTETKPPSEQVASMQAEVTAECVAASYEDAGMSREDMRRIGADPDALEQAAHHSAVSLCILRVMDAEHERRAKFEVDATRLLGIIERSQLDVLTRVESLEAWRDVEAQKADPRESTAADGIFAALMSADPSADHSALAGLTGDDSPPPDAREWLAKIAIPCSVGMPDAEIRVLFFVPGEPRDRWRTGHWDNTARAPRWWDDFTSAGDEPVLYKPEQVTHWMPMPGEPTA